MKDGQKVVTSSNKGQIIQWHALNLQYLLSTDVHDYNVQAMCWSSYQKYLVTGDKQGYIVYCNNMISHKNKFQAHINSCIRDISFSMSSVKFVSCSADTSAKIWDFATSKQECEFKEHNQEVATCDWHPFHSLVATGSKDKTIRIWDPRNHTEKSLFQLQPHTNSVEQVKWNPINGNFLLSGSKDQKIKLFDIRNLKEALKEFHGHKDPVLAI